MDKLGDLEGIGIVRFTNSDIVRHSLVGKIIDRLESE
jgi:phosphate starvation-inducible protein PhoH